jgi:hypothetical protein
VSNIVLAVRSGGRELVVKQAPPHLRVAAPWAAKRERALTEAALPLACRLTPDSALRVLDQPPASQGDPPAERAGRASAAPARSSRDTSFRSPRRWSATSGVSSPRAWTGSRRSSTSTRPGANGRAHSRPATARAAALARSGLEPAVTAIAGILAWDALD